MKREYEYLIGGALISAAVLLGMGIVGQEKQTGEGRYQFVPTGDISNAGEPLRSRLFAVIDSQSGTVNYVDIGGKVTIFSFETTTKADQPTIP